MKQFIELTDMSGKKICININHITSIKESNSQGTKVTLTEWDKKGNLSVFVSEPYGEVKKQLRQIM
ncbi:hypothetical protein [Gottfriedia acidiceleris]|uniref:hypothetical protein n=1 Tax=Gottfriedia acidiceleris TaxID=371036 RepID=UPI003D1B0B42